MKRCLLFILLEVALCGLFSSLNPVFAQGSAFTYQGRLASASGTALTGTYDMQFKLHPASFGTNQVGPTFTNSAVAVSNGLFTVTLDFTGAPFTGGLLWLEVGVRTNGSVAPYDVMSPTQLLTSAPFAIRAAIAGQAVSLIGGITDSQLSTNIPELNGSNVFSGSVTLSNGHGNFNGALSGTFNGTGTLTGNFNGTGTGTFSGNGAGMTNINVTNVTGIVAANPNWQIMQSTSQQAASANNYLTTNSALTTLNLPTSPGVGDVFRFSGSGVSGWRLTQNSGQSILTTILGVPAGKNWISQAGSPSTTWRTLASSADGTKLVGGAFNGSLYTSTNAGQTWVARVGSAPWISVASSADGTRLAAAQNGSFIAISFDSGATWTNHASSLFWYSVTTSADGTKLAAVVNGGSIYTSLDSGITWSNRASSLGSQPWYSITSSADGTKLAAAINNGPIYTSTDSGITWSNRTLTKPWYSIASSSDGTKLVAAANGDYIYTSGDSGANWTARTTSLSTQPWFAMASSGDGTCLVGVVNNGLIYSSLDSGQTWAARTAGSQPWNAVCVSTDGTRAAAGISAVSGGLISTSVSATTVGAGSLQGNQYSNIELQYIGGGQWMPLSFSGTFGAN